jgi:predicted alpha/beta-fold hydrolase
MYEGTALPASVFSPHPLLRNAHLQTLWPLLARRPGIEPHRERLELCDGDFIDVGWVGPRYAGRPIAVLVHGLSGGMESRYVLRMARCLAAQGWSAALLQLRGAGAEPNRLPRGYHHGDTDDFRWFCRRLRRSEPDAPLVAVGWSLGASVVLKALGEEGSLSPLDGAVTISAPFDLEHCARHLRTRGRLYQSLMLRELKRCLQRKHPPVAAPGADLALAMTAPDFFAFGDAYIAPVNGFDGVRDYCRQAACGRYLQDVRKPAVVLQALDDPVLGPDGVLLRHPAAACVNISLSPHGGHAGFVAAGPRGSPRLWLEQRIPELLQRWQRP